MVVSRDEMVKMMLASNGKFFHVCFNKRSNGEYREMTCRVGVAKHVKGVGEAYNPADYDLVRVFEMQKKGLSNDTQRRITTLSNRRCNL